jgi:putative nucleotidyltransferase with HDIG domain
VPSQGDFLSVSDAVDPRRYLPHAAIATVVVIVLPALVVLLLAPDGALGIVLSVVLAATVSALMGRICAALWMRRPESRDLVFGDLMLWGWLRRVRAERRLAEAARVLGTGRHAGPRSGTPRSHQIEALTRLSAQLEARDPYTHGHTRRVTRHSERIARELGLAPQEVARIRTAAALHDIGKVRTPRAILGKPGRLTDAELSVIRRHPADGASMVTEIGDPDIAAMVRHHHERIDGTGYPDGLAGDEIPRGARIIAVADTFDALTSARPYRGACSHKKALDLLGSEAGTQLDADAVSAFVSYYSGRRSIAGVSLVAGAPQRLAGWLAGAPAGIGAGVAPVAQQACIAGVAVLAGACLPSSPAPAAAGADAAAGPAAPVPVAERLEAPGRAPEVVDEAAVRDRGVPSDRSDTPSSPTPPDATGDADRSPLAAPAAPQPSQDGTRRPETPATSPGPPRDDAVDLPEVGRPSIDPAEIVAPILEEVPEALPVPDLRKPVERLLEPLERIGPIRPELARERAGD